MKTQKAFTLVELVITITVAAILLGLGVPAFRTMIQNNRMTSHANEFVAAMNLTRSEAIKRGADVLITATDSSDSADEWGAGWTVWVDLDGDGSLDLNQNPPEDLRIVAAFDDTTTLNGPDGTSAFTYGANGALNGGGQTLDLCHKAGDRGRQLTIAPSGRISMNSEYTCP